VAQTIIDSIQRQLNLIIYVHLDILNVLKSPSFKDGFYFRDKKKVGWQKVRWIGLVAGLHQAKNCQEALHYHGRVNTGTGLQAELTIIIWKLQPHLKNSLQQPS